MKNKNGITLIALTITIIVLIIIASISVYSGMNSFHESKERKQISELSMVQQAILQQYQIYRKTGNKDYLVGEPIPYNEVKEIEEEFQNIDSSINLKQIEYDISTDNPEDFYYLLEKKENEIENVDTLKDIGITSNSEDDIEYIVNYSTGEVFNNMDIKTRSGKALYIYAIEAEREDVQGGETP